MRSFGILFLFSVLFIKCSGDGGNDNAASAINSEDLESYIKTLSSDEFQGRKPSTPGEEKTITFLKEKFEGIGLLPGNGESFFQEVPVVEIETNVEPVLEIKGNGQTTRLKHKEEYTATSSWVTEEEIIIDDAELVFCGYGISAPEYNWNDYADTDVKGKIAVVLVNDPGFATKDSNLFTGNAMTYYGRWTYKYEEAARQGAAGCIIIHQTEPASYPWEVVKNGWTGSQYYLIPEDNNLSSCKMEAWINLDKAKEIFKHAGLNFENLTEAAAEKSFKAVPMGLTLSTRLNNSIKKSVTNNVIAVLPGAERKNEYIIYTAHWDHFGIDTTLETEDKIYNGARDNATGTAALIELAEAFTKLPQTPERSIVFLAVTAEEQGLLGSRHYSENPIYPLNKTVAVINMDALNIFGKMKDMTIIGYGKSELDKYVEAAAEEQNRIVRPDPTPEKGSFYRSDHFSFAKHGVPSIYAKGGEQHVEKGEEWGKKKIAEWTEKYYHTVEDEFNPQIWDMEGMVEDIRLLFKVGYKLSQEESFPDWNEGNEFKAVREKSMNN